MKPTRGAGVLVALVALIGLLIAGLIGYVVGSDQRSLGCEKGEVLSVSVEGADERGNGRHVVSMGDCERFDNDTFVAVVEALVSGRASAPAQSTSTTKAPAAGAAAGG